MDGPFEVHKHPIYPSLNTNPIPCVTAPDFDLDFLLPPHDLDLLLPQLLVELALDLPQRLLLRLLDAEQLLVAAPLQGLFMDEETLILFL